MIEYLCICGHTEEFHIVSNFGFGGCEICIRDLKISYRQICRSFKLDNLRYIEALAKERNLI